MRASRLKADLGPTLGTDPISAAKFRQFVDNFVRRFLKLKAPHYLSFMILVSLGQIGPAVAAPPDCRRPSPKDLNLAYQQARETVINSLSGMSLTAVRDSIAEIEAKTPTSVRSLMDASLLQTFLGPIGEIYRFEEPRPLRRAKLEKNESLALVEAAKFRERQSRVRPEDRNFVLTFLRQALGFKDLRELTRDLPDVFKSDRILVKASLVSSQHLSGFEQALLHHFQLTGSKTVIFVYRYSGLEKHRHLTGATMLDEIRAVIKEGRGYNIHLSYERSVFELKIDELASSYRDWLEATDPLKKNEIINQVNQGNSFFLPSSGIVTTDFIFPVERATEFKRYFQNPIPDVLGIAQIDSSPNKANQERLRMLIRVIDSLDESTPLEIHAHSTVHKMAYLKLGFELERETVNPLYPDVTVAILVGKKKTVLAAIESQLLTEE